MRRVLEYSRGIGAARDRALRGPEPARRGRRERGRGLDAARPAGQSPAAAETVMVARDLELARLTGAHLHVAHVSTRRRSVELIRERRGRGVRVTAEVTPHHLALTDEAIARLRHQHQDGAAAAQRARPRGAAARGSPTARSTRSPPTTRRTRCYEKDVEFTAAPFGVIGFETAFAVALELVREERMTAARAGATGSRRDPARMLGIAGRHARSRAARPTSCWSIPSGAGTYDPAKGSSRRARRTRRWPGARAARPRAAHAGRRTPRVRRSSAEGCAVSASAARRAARARATARSTAGRRSAPTRVGTGEVVLQHQHDRLPGDPHRSVVRRADRVR